MRRAVAIAAAVALGGLLVTGCGGGGEARPGTATAHGQAASTPTATTPGRGVVTPKPDEIVDVRAPEPGRPSLFLAGDSLGVGMARYLQRDLPGWTVSVAARNGLVAGLGMPLWRQQSTPYTVSAFSLFTNDDPANLAGLEQIVRESVERTFSRCAIWATIRAPPRNGVDFDAANALLYRLEREYRGRLLIVPWAETVTTHPWLDLGDYVHATDEGYAVRARMYADAARRCVRQAA